MHSMKEDDFEIQKFKIQNSKFFKSFQKYSCFLVVAYYSHAQGNTDRLKKVGTHTKTHKKHTHILKKIRTPHC